MASHHWEVAQTFFLLHGAGEASYDRYDMSNLEGKGQEVRKQINAMFISKKTCKLLGKSPRSLPPGSRPGFPHPVLLGPPPSLSPRYTLCECDFASPQEAGFLRPEPAASLLRPLG